jgi:hypothetical protein
MLYREIIAVCSDFHTKHINILYGQNVELLSVKLVVHILVVTTELYREDLEEICDSLLQITIPLYTLRR